MKKSIYAAAAAAGAVALIIAQPLSASAHVSVTPTSDAAGSYTVLSFAVGHGCEGSPTTGLTIDIPEGIVAATPTVSALWDVKKVMGDLNPPITDSHGESIAQRVTKLEYTAKTPLEDGFRDTVSFQVQLPADAAGTDIAFPVLQTCEVGETRWDQPTKAGEDEPALPAPFVSVTASSDEGEHGGGHGAAEESAEAASSDGPDTVARVLGIGGLAVGAVGVVIALLSRRRNGASS